MDNPSGGPGVAEIRETLRRIISDVMEIAPSAVEDDAPLLDVVTSSVALVEGMRMAYDNFGVLISVRRVLEGQADLNGLAVYIAEALQEQRKELEAGGDVGGGDRDGDPQRTPLAPSQRHAAFLCRYSQEASAAYNEPLAVRLEGPVHVAALQAALEATADRHEALRMALCPTADALETRPARGLELEVASCAEEAWDAHLADEARRPFEAGERLFRARLLGLGGEKYILILTGHALLVDQCAMRLVFDEVAEIYGMVAGASSGEPLPPGAPWTAPPALAGPDRDAAEAYWKDLFAGGVPLLELPGDRPRSPVKGYVGAEAVTRVEADLARGVEGWAQSLRLATDDVWQAAFALLLHRLSGQDELLLGAEATRNSADGQRLAARTTDKTPVWSAYDPQSTFREHARQYALGVSEARAHAGLSLSELIQCLDLPRDQSRSALFTAAFRHERRPASPRFQGLRSAWVSPPAQTSRYDVELALVSDGTSTELRCVYSPELFDLATIQRWMTGLLVLVDAAIERDADAVSLLPLMPAEERRLIIQDWNATERDYPMERTALGLVSEHIRRHPERTALRFGGEEWTYGELGQEVEAIAGRLTAQGAGPGERVAVLLERSPYLVAALLAVWRAGAAYVPLDLTFPKKRIEFMLVDADARIVVTSRHAAQRLGEGSHSDVLYLDEQSDASARIGVEFPSPRGAGTAYLMYTSGSTGRPKGVEVTHASLTNLLLGSRDLLEFTESDSLLAVTTASFDISCLEMFLPLVSGGVVEIGEEGLAMDGVALVQRLRASTPSFFQATPSTYKALLAAGWGGTANMRLLSAGEALPRDLAEDLLRRCHTLWNLYGPTETTVYSSAYRVTSAPDEPVRIGRPYPNTRIYILDEHLQPLPICCVGGLYIGGVGVATGYWNRPELTEARFIPDPFRPGERIYATGDLARYLPCGDIVCLGRVDDQVKVHGVRLELGELETALREIPGVADAVAAPWTDADGNSQLVGHVIPADGAPLTSAAVRAELRESLPEAMIPPFVVFAESFPLTANGKVRRTALPPPAAGAQPDKTRMSPPETPTEQQLAQAWSRVLNLDASRIGREDAFLDLGGHSLLMTQLMLEVRKLFHVSFTMREFFDAPTLHQLAARIDEKRRERTASGGDGRPAAVRDSEWGKQRMDFLRREAEVPANIAPARGLTYEQPSQTRAVLLTGATGFVGAYLAAELLNRTDADVYCLVRRRPDVSSKARIEHQLRAYAVWGDDEVWRTAWERRIHVVEGDVILPRLGLADPVYESLSRDVDCIIHSAAHVNFIYPYEALRATNVLGVHETIRFALHGRIKPVHYLSTAAVWPMGSELTFYEKDSLDHGMLLNLGYDEAKWVAERCLVNAAERGLPAARYRPGEVGGDSETGRCVLSHFIVAAFKGFLQLGAFPAVDTYIDVTPVDYVAKALVHMAFRGHPLGRAFHLTNPGRRHMSEALEFLRSQGYRFEEVAFEELRDRLVHANTFGDNALFPYQAALEDMDERSLQVPRYDCRKTLKQLEGSGITCPPVDDNLLGTYMRYLKSIGYLEEPEALSVGVGA